MPGTVTRRTAAATIPPRRQVAAATLALLGTVAVDEKGSTASRWVAVTVRVVSDHRGPAFSYARTLLVPEANGWRAYLLCVRDGFVSVSRLGWHPTPSAAGEETRVFYQERLTTLAVELQARFHAQVSEREDPYRLLARVVETGSLPRLTSIDRTQQRHGQARAWVALSDLEEHELPRVGAQVLLAGDVFPDRLAVVEAVEAVEERHARCRLEGRP